MDTVIFQQVVRSGYTGCADGNVSAAMVKGTNELLRALWTLDNAVLLMTQVSRPGTAIPISMEA